MGVPVANYVAQQIQYATKIRDKKKLSRPEGCLSVAGLTSYATTDEAAGWISLPVYRNQPDISSKSDTVTRSDSFLSAYFIGTGFLKIKWLSMIGFVWINLR